MKRESRENDATCVFNTFQSSRRNKNQYFPTYFAAALAHEVKLFPQHNYYRLGEDKKILFHKIADRLKCFQELAMVCEIEDCMIVYKGRKLSERQKKILEIIHTATPRMARGDCSSFILSRMEKSEDGREVKALTESLVLMIDDKDVNSLPVADMVGRLVINTTVRE